MKTVEEINISLNIIVSSYHIFFHMGFHFNQYSVLLFYQVIALQVGC